MFGRFYITLPQSNVFSATLLLYFFILFYQLCKLFALSLICSVIIIYLICSHYHISHYLSYVISHMFAIISVSKLMKYVCMCSIQFLYCNTDYFPYSSFNVNIMEDHLVECKLIRTTRKNMSKIHILMCFLYENRRLMFI